MVISRFIFIIAFISYLTKYQGQSNLIENGSFSIRKNKVRNSSHQKTNKPFYEPNEPFYALSFLGWHVYSAFGTESVSEENSPRFGLTKTKNLSFNFFDNVDSMQFNNEGIVILHGNQNRTSLIIQKLEKTLGKGKYLFSIKINQEHEADSSDFYYYPPLNVIFLNSIKTVYSSRKLSKAKKLKIYPQKYHSYYYNPMVQYNFNLELSGEENYILIGFLPEKNQKPWKYFGQYSYLIDDIKLHVKNKDDTLIPEITKLKMPIINDFKINENLEYSPDACNCYGTEFTGIHIGDSCKKYLNFFIKYLLENPESKLKIHFYGNERFLMRNYRNYIYYYLGDTSRVQFVFEDYKGITRNVSNDLSVEYENKFNLYADKCCPYIKYGDKTDKFYNAFYFIKYKTGFSIIR